MKACPTTNPLRARWESVPGVVYPAPRGAEVTRGETPSAKWMSSEEAAEKLGVTASAARTRLHRHKVKHKLFALPSGIRMYWNRSGVMAIVDKLPTADVPEGMLTTREACEKLGIGRTSLIRYEQAGELHPLRCRGNSGAYGKRIQNYYDKAEIERLAQNAPKKAARIPRR